MSSVPSPATAAPVVDFFHDVVCGWCFVLAPRLQQVSAELGIQVRHRSFVLQDSRAQMVEVFGSMERAKAIILRHWTDCAAHEDTARIDIEGMRAQDFEVATTPMARCLMPCNGRTCTSTATSATPKYCWISPNRWAIHVAPSLTTCAATQYASACRPIVPKPLPSASVPYPP